MHNQSIEFKSGHSSKNRLMLAPMTNQQSREDGHLTDEEYNWLTMRAKGGFGMVMTCAAHVQLNGKGFPGQLGIFADTLIDDHKRLSNGLKVHGALSIVQLYHGGMRSPSSLIEQSPICPSDHAEFGARAMTIDEIRITRDNFILAAKRAQLAGYDGVELHAAHGYLLCQFLSAAVNKRKDLYGGDLIHRSRLIFEILEAIRLECGNTFMVGIRLSPERFGMDVLEIKQMCNLLVDSDLVDFIDLSLWDVDKKPLDVKYESKSLLDHFLSLDFKDVKWTVSGKIDSALKTHELLSKGIDFLTIGRAGILHHDFPLKVINDPKFQSVDLPVSENYLKGEGLGPVFMEYMKKWKGFVQ